MASADARRRPVRTRLAALGNRRSGMIALAAVCLLSLGAGLGVLLSHRAVPATLAGEDSSQMLDVAETSYAGHVPVTLTVESGAPATLTVPVDGRITATSCSPGGVLRSGESALAVDGRSILGFSTAVPPWRSLVIGDRGGDVRAVQEELARLGRPVSVTGTLTADTVAQWRTLFGKSSGGQSPREPGIGLSDVLWLPRAEASPSSCALALGARVGADAEFAQVPGAPSAVHVSAPVPEGDGWQLRVGTVTVPAPAESTISDPESLAALASSPLIRGAATSADKPEVPASFVLAEPLTVIAVPPASVFGIAGDAGCVLTPSGPVAVRIRGSQLGSTFVTALGDEAITRVETHPGRDAACPSS